jgi:RNA polymerase sigma-70 factor (ECF subfamily)
MVFLHMSEEETIVRRVLEGDSQAFRWIVERYQGPVYRLVRNLLARTADVEDLAQDAFLAAYQNLAAFDSQRGSFAAWLFTIARNKCLNAAKRRRLVGHADAEPVDSRTPELALAEGEWLQRFDAALAALPFEQRAAFLLAEIEGLPYEEIARIEGVPLGTVKSRISRAKEKLRGLLEPELSER